MSKLQLFQYAVLRHPSDKEVKEGKKTIALLPIGTILAVNEKAAGMQIVMDLPQEEKENTDLIEILIRPF